MTKERLQVRLLPLDLIHEIEIRLVKVVHTHVTVLSATAVPSSLGVDSDIVEGTEMAPDSSNLLHKKLVVEPRFELSLSRAGCGDVHGCLTSSKDHKVLHGRDSGAVEGSVGGVCLENLKVIRGDQLELRLARF